MITWVREKVAERRQKWKRKNDSTNSNSDLLRSSSTAVGGDTEINSGPAESPPASNDIQNSSNQNLPDQIISEDNSADNLNIRVYTATGKSTLIKILKSKCGKDLKKEAIRLIFMHGQSLASPAGEEYYLVHSKTKRKINELLTLDDLNITSQDEFILSRKIVNVTNIENLSGPKLDEVIAATKHIQPQRETPPIVNIESLLHQNDLQFDIRKILISLAQSSAYVIGAGPYAERLLAMLKLRILNRYKHEADTVKCLVDMGFTKERATYALRIKNNVYTAALEWLIDHQGSSSSIQIAVSPDSSDMTKSFCKDSIKVNSQQNIEALLEIIRIHAHYTVPPTKDTIKSLVDMGFSEDRVIDALKVTRNNQAAACEWLLGSRSRSLTELRDGLQLDSPVLRALLASPQVQISLGSPKMFIAYVSMLENYSSMSMWLGDNDTSGILGHILRTYHEEKHIIAINQFSSML